MEAKIKAALGDELRDACANGDVDAVKEYLSRQKAVNDSYTPPWSAMIYTAASKDQANIVQYCLNNGAKITRYEMQTILINRAKKTYALLLDTKAVDIDDYIPWFGDILGNVATADDLEWTEFCLSRGADPNKNLVDEHKPLLAAVAELASLETAKLLVEHGAKVKGSGAIVTAAEEGKSDIVRYLLDKGADINEIGIEHPQDERSKEDMGSALHRAVQGGHENVVRFLIDKGADLILKDPMGRAPMALAQAKEDARLIEVLKEHGATD